MISKKTISINAFSLYFGNLFTMATGIVSVYFLSRYMGPEQYGQYSFIVSYVVMFMMLSEFGLGQIITREISKYPEDKANILGAGVVLSGGIGILAFLAALGCYFLFGYDRTLFLGTLIYSIKLPLSFMAIGRAVYQASFRNHISVIINAVTRLLYVVLVVFFVKLQLSLGWFLLLLAFSEIIVDAVRVIILRSEEAYSFAFDHGAINKLALECLPLAASIFCISVYMKCNVIILTKMASFSEVGLYSAAERIVQLLNVIPQNLAVVFFPLFSMYVHKEPARAERILSKGVMYLSAIGGILSAALFLYATPLVTLLYGHNFDGAGGLLGLFAVQVFFVFSSLCLGSYLVAAGRQNVNFLADAVAMIVNLGLCFLLIPTQGAFGAVLAAVLVKVGLFVFMVTYFMKEMKVSLDSSKIFLNLFVVLFFILFLRYTGLYLDFASVMLCVLIYAWLMIRFKFVAIDDFKMFFSMAR